MQSDYKKVLQIFASYTNDGKSYRIPDDAFHKSCLEVLVGDVDETINGMIIGGLMTYEYIDPSEGHVYILQDKGIKALRRIYNV